jgi:hypothetical protein
VEEADGIFGIGGKNSKQQNQSIGNLSNLFNFGMSQASSLTSSGAADTGAASGYFKSLVSGNRNAVQAAIAPQANEVRSAADAQKRQASAMGTARGGGTAGTNQQTDTNTQATIDNAMFGARSGAAGQLAQIGAGETGAGLSAAGTAGSAASAEGTISTDARQQAANEQANAIKSVVGAIFG